jgi:16S rRNA (uracil1498-N3)-methyltransferase
MRPSKLEWIIEKGTELGADCFFLYPAEKSQKENLSEHHLERLQNITISALKQSKRAYLPSIEKVDSLALLCAKEKNLFFGDVEGISHSNISFPSSLLFITGPESGFSKKELSLLREKGVSILLNQNVLRAETAPITALSILFWEMGKLH